MPSTGKNLHISLTIAVLGALLLAVASLRRSG
jgi:hypothetical protein